MLSPVIKVIKSKPKGKNSALTVSPPII